MNLKEAIAIGGQDWKTSYPVICQAALDVLQDIKVTADKPMLTRELQDAILERGGLFDNAANRIVVYKALTNNSVSGRTLENYHSRVPAPDPSRVGKTRMTYVWHMPSVAAQVAALEAKREFHRGEVAAINIALDELQGDA